MVSVLKQSDGSFVRSDDYICLSFFFLCECLLSSFAQERLEGGGFPRLLHIEFIVIFVYLLSAENLLSEGQHCAATKNILQT